MNETYEELSFRDYARSILRRKWLVVATALACVAAALAVTALQDPVYKATSRLSIRPAPTENVFGNAAQPDRRVTAEIQLLQSSTVQLRVQSALGLTGLPPAAEGTAAGSTVIDVTVRDSSANEAKRFADAYAQAYIDVRFDEIVDGFEAASAAIQPKLDAVEAQIQAIDDRISNATPETRAQVRNDNSTQRKALASQQAAFARSLDELAVDNALATGGAQLVRPAVAPSEPIEPKPLRSALFALIGGLVLGLILAFLFDRLDGSVRASSELEKATDGTPVLAVVPGGTLPDHRPISLSSPTDLTVEAYRTLRTNLQFLGIDRSMRIIQVSSAMAGEGKTTTATNLAVVTATAGNRVVLIDADLRRPTVHRVFGIDGEKGLTNALLGEPVDGLMQHVSVEGGTLSVLSAGRIPPNPSELLGGKAMTALLQSLAADADVVVLDSAPILPVTDAVALSRSVDALLLVAHAGKTSRKQVAEAVRTLSRVSVTLVGTVMNRVSKRRMHSGDFGYGSGYGAGYSYQAEPEIPTIAPSAQPDQDELLSL